MVALVVRLIAQVSATLKTSTSLYFKLYSTAISSIPDKTNEE
jgi:hypothetical protein